MDSSPLPENIEGKLVETHSFDHEIHHSVRWDYLAGIVVVTIVLALLAKKWPTDRESEGEETAELVEEENRGAELW